MKKMLTYFNRNLFLVCAFCLLSQLAWCDNEPNNSLAEANPLAFNTNQAGSLYNSPDDTEDWYQIEVPENGTVTISGFYGTGLSGYVYMYNGSGSQLSFVYVAQDEYVLNVSCIRTGTAYIRLTRTSGSGEYDVSVDVTPPQYENDSEPNDASTVAESVDLIQDSYTENQNWTGHLGHNNAEQGLDDNDYFYIISPRDGDVTLNVNYDETLAGYIYLLKKDGSQIGFTYIDGTSSSYTAQCYASDTLIARISRTSGCGSYTASFTTSDNLADNDQEPNHASTVNASIGLISETFQENETWSGHLGYIDVDTGTDNNDYFYIISPRDGDVTLNVDYDETLAGYIYLYDKDGTQIGFTYLAGVSESYTAACRSADTLIARLSRTSGCGSYTASFNTPVLQFANDEEQNDEVESAIPVPNYLLNEGHLGYRDADSGTDNDDYYRFEVNEVPFQFETTLTKSADFTGYIYLLNEVGGNITFVYHGGSLETTMGYEFTEPGTYHVRVNRSGSCGSYSLDGFCANPPEVSASANGETHVCPGESVMLTANEGLDEYVWFRDGIEVGEGQQFNATMDGEYYVMGIDGNTCASNSNIISVTYQPDSDDDGYCDEDDNCPFTPGLIGDSCDDGDSTTEFDELNAECNCVGSPIATVSTLEQFCGEKILQVTYAVSGMNSGGMATGETRTIYSFDPDNGNEVPTYSGSAWPYVIIPGGLIIDSEVDANLSINPNGVLLVNGWPAYQYTGDNSASEANGTFGPWSYFTLEGTQSQNVCQSDLEVSIEINASCLEREFELHFYETGSNNLSSTYSGTISDELLIIEDVEYGEHDIYLKIDGFLAVSSLSANLGVGMNSFSMSNLIAGDLNGDNGINVIDFSSLNAAFGSSTGDDNYNYLADLNCDGGVNILDFSSLNAGFGLTGAEPTDP